MGNLLKEHGIEILDSVPIPGYERFEFRDPFGNRVECIKPLTEAKDERNGHATIFKESPDYEKK